MKYTNTTATLALLALLATAARAESAAPIGTGKDHAPVRVVATLPVYAEIVREIGGAEVEVSSIADPHEDAHFVRPKPSFAADIRRADLFVTTGLDLELWVPPLLDKAHNARVSEGGPGYVTTYTGIKLLDVPTSADRAAGDIHIYGNPHVFTDPLNAIIIARNITIGLRRVAPDRADVWDRGLEQFTDRIYRRTFGDRLVDIMGGESLTTLARSGQLADFLRRTPYQGKPLADLLGGWLEAGEAFRGKRVLCYHKNWAYFEDRFGVTCAEYVEAKPGIPPTPGHVAALIDMMRNQNVGVLMAAGYFSESQVASVANRGGGRYVMMPMEPGAAPGVDTYFDMVDAWVNGLARAFGGK